MKKNNYTPRFIAIIPARYASTRFPGKPLAKIGGVEMIVRVCQRVMETVDEVVVATDDEKIASCVRNNGFKAVMTSTSHKSGTDRIMEAYESLQHTDSDIIINVQGDEPFIHSEQIQQLKNIFISNQQTSIATLAMKFNPDKGFETLSNTNLVKVAISKTGKALYFSRNVIPYVRGCETDEWLNKNVFYSHIGIYGYKAKTLREITSMSPTSLEEAESLEQLRWLESGYDIAIGVTEYNTIGIDTPEDLISAEQYLTSKE